MSLRYEPLHNGGNGSTFQEQMTYNGEIWNIQYLIWELTAFFAILQFMSFTCLKNYSLHLKRWSTVTKVKEYKIKYVFVKIIWIYMLIICHKCGNLTRFFLTIVCSGVKPHYIILSVSNLTSIYFVFICTDYNPSKRNSNYCILCHTTYRTKSHMQAFKERSELKVRTKCNNYWAVSVGRWQCLAQKYLDSSQEAY